MDIPYTVEVRRDTGLNNGKLGIWLFLASEVMLFGGLFSSYILLRVGADPGTWPQGLLNIPIGTCYVPTPHAKPGNEVGIDIRGKLVKAEIVKTPFYKSGSHL